MQTYVIAVRDRALYLESNDQTLVRTSIGVDQIEIRFYTGEWLEGFDLYVAFANNGVTEEPIEPTSTPDEEWLAAATVPVPDERLAFDGQLGVTVHGVDDDGNHIITERAYPLTVEHEGIAGEA